VRPCEYDAVCAKVEKGGVKMIPKIGLCSNCKFGKKQGEQYLCCCEKENHGWGPRTGKLLPARYQCIAHEFAEGKHDDDGAFCKGHGWRSEAS